MRRTKAGFHLGRTRKDLCPTSLRPLYGPEANLPFTLDPAQPLLPRVASYPAWFNKPRYGSRLSGYSTFLKDAQKGAGGPAAWRRESVSLAKAMRLSRVLARVLSDR